MAVRAVLYRDLPALVTADSWDYLQAARDIFRDGDFFSPALRDVRLPGYPTFLALTYPITHLHSDRLVQLQMGLGLASVALGFAIGKLLGSRLVSLTMMAFLGLSPIYLLHEHAIMCEALSLTLYVALVVAGLASVRPTAGWRSWAALGMLIGLAMVTRANSLALGGAMAVAACVARWRAETGAVTFSAGAIRGVRSLRPALLAVAVAFVVVAPWLYRNWSAYGRPVVFTSTNRNLLMYKSMHGRVDPTTPTFATLNRTLGYDWVDFEWLSRLTGTYPMDQAEELAGRILAEEVAKHTRQHLWHVAGAGAGFLGFAAYLPHERTAMVHWFQTLVSDVTRMNALATASPSAAQTRDWLYVPRERDTPATRLFARAGSLYLLPGRAIASVVVLGMTGIYLVRRAMRGRWADLRFGIVLVLAAGYLATVAMHAVTLSDFDRYSSMFDFVLALIAALIADHAIAGGLLARREDRVEAR